MALRWHPKDKDEINDYSVDWSRTLDSGETLTGISWSIDAADGTKTPVVTGSTVNGLTVGVIGLSASVATIFLSAGTNNVEYRLWCQVTTSANRTLERPVKIRIREYN